MSEHTCSSYIEVGIPKCVCVYAYWDRGALGTLPKPLPSDQENILREKSLAIYFEDSQFIRIRTFNFIVSKIYVDKRSRVR